MGHNGDLTMGLRFRDRIWGIWGSYYNIPKAMFYLLQGDYDDRPLAGVCILGGPWDLVTTYNWAYEPTYTWGNLYKPI